MAACTDHDRCQRDAIDRARRVCAARGTRLTPQRELVLRLVWESHRPVKAYDLLERLEGAATKTKPKPPTVYRALDFLKANGLVHRLDSINAYTGCGHPNSHGDCYFMICRQCGTASECCAPAIRSALDAESGRQGFAAESATLEITGICADCGRDGGSSGPAGARA